MTKIDDVITDLPVPDDVIGVTDRYGEVLVLNAVGHWHGELAADPETCWMGAVPPCGLVIGDYLPLIVKAVREVAAPDPIRLPEAPAGAIALKGNRTGVRYVPSRRAPEGWVKDDGNVMQMILAWAKVLEREGADGVTPEFAPPRQPRVWPRVEHIIGAGGFPEVVETTMPDRPTERWNLVTDDGLYTGPRGGRWTLAELRTLGTVTEVFGDA